MRHPIGKFRRGLSALEVVTALGDFCEKGRNH